MARGGECKDWEGEEKCQKIVDGGLCAVKYYCWKCAKSCGQCELTTGICSGTSLECDLPACDEQCFDWKPQDYCDEVKASGGCDNKNKCWVCSKTCDACHGACSNAGNGGDSGDTCKNKWNDKKCEKFAKKCKKTCGAC